MTKSRLSPFAIRAVTLALACAGCAHPPALRVHLVFVPDLSKSIEANAREASLREIESASLQLRRGDAFAVIPITGDAAHDAPPELLRLQFATERQPFDGDLARIVTEEHAGLARIGSAKLSDRTDLFGTLELAREEASHEPAGTGKAIAFLSDFIEDRGSINFARDLRLKSTRTAEEFAVTLAGTSHDLAGIRVFLGELPSLTAARLPDARRRAIKLFWIEYLQRRGADAEWATDGAGELAQFVRSVMSAPADGSGSVAATTGFASAAQQKPTRGQGS